MTTFICPCQSESGPEYGPETGPEYGPEIGPEYGPHESRIVKSDC